MGFLDRLFGRRGAVKIADVVEGTAVRVTGKVSCGDALIAPYTGRACAYWRLEFVQQQLDRVATLTAWDARDFTIDDGTGRAHILAEACEFDVIANFVEMERASNVSDKARALAQHYDWGPFEAIAQLNISEAIIAIGEQVDVEGIGTREPALDVDHSERGFRDPVATDVIFSSGTKVRGKQRDAVFIGDRR